MSTECTCGDQADYTTAFGAGNVSCTMAGCGDCCPICHPRYCPCCGRLIQGTPWRPWNPWVYPTYPPYYADPYPQPYITWCEGTTGDFPNMTATITIQNNNGDNGNASCSDRAP